MVSSIGEFDSWQFNVIQLVLDVGRYADLGTLAVEMEAAAL
jgi:hypothetical protein